MWMRLQQMLHWAFLVTSSPAWMGDSESALFLKTNSVFYSNSEFNSLVSCASEMVAFIPASTYTLWKTSKNNVNSLCFISCHIKGSHCCKFECDVNDDNAFFFFQWWIVLCDNANVTANRFSLWRDEWGS